MVASRSRVFQFLKTHGKSSLKQIVKGIHGLPGEVADILDIEVARGYIRKDETTIPVRYSVKIKLGRLVKKEEIVPLWRHKEIVQRAGVPEIKKIPQALLKALLEALFWWQGSRGTCVGFAGALYRWKNYLLNTGDIPTIEEIRAAGKIIEEDIKCTAGLFKYMVLPSKFPSPQFIYERSREFGGATFPAGSDTTWAAKIIANEGTVTWDKCLTSITALCAPRLWPMVEADYSKTLAVLAPIATEHRNKFAASNDFNEVFQAIKDGKSVFGPVNLPPDYFEPPNGEWQPYGGGSAGGHAVFAALVDESERLILTRGSWDGDGGLKWYSFGERFFDENAGPFLIGLTQEEAKIGESLYKSLTITANIPAWVRVDGVVIGTTPQRFAVEKGKIYVITVGADGYIAQTTMGDDSKTELSFMLDPVPVVKKTWLQLLIEWIAALFRRK